jgi:LDH2 family malate/lactate/ureidoglycolate dehydrogenase
MTRPILIPHGDLVALIARALEPEGVPPHVREIEAEVMAEADLTGVPSHGVRMLPLLIHALRRGAASPDPRIRVVREHRATCVLDCDNGPGRHVSVEAMNHAVRKACASGVGVCLATRTTHWGRAHAYAFRAATAGMIGLCTTNAIPNMIAWGSTRPVLANNPLAIGVPRGRGKDPIVMDMAMSQTAVGKVGTHMREGMSVPLGWGLDRAGLPTTDAGEIMASRRFLPMGDHKGTGLSIMMELLTGALAGAYLSHEIVRMDNSTLDSNATKFFIALDVESFTERENFERKVEEFLEYLKETSEQGETAHLPGQRGWQTRDRYLEEGIPIHPNIAASLRELGIQLPE